MKIIQSFWTSPMLRGRETMSNNRLSGGWLEMKYHLMSWAYSCLRLRSCYNQVELITDTAGKVLLVQCLQLPYTDCRVILDDLNQSNPDWWALGKILAFQSQTTPFIHIDGDVFLWERLPERVENGRLVAQNLEIDFPLYREVMNGLSGNRAYIPPDILENYRQDDRLPAYNAGIIGGSDLSFFREYTREAFAFARCNSLNGLPASGMVNAFYEQHLYYCMARKKGITVECYTDATDPDVLNDNLKSLRQFQGAPATASYIHLFGEDAKKNIQICQELARRLRCEYPEHFHRIMAL